MGQYEGTFDSGSGRFTARSVSTGSGGSSGGGGIIGFMIVVGAITLMLAPFFENKPKKSSNQQVVVEDVGHPWFLSPRSNAVAVPASPRDLGLVPSGYSDAPVSQPAPSPEPVATASDLASQPATVKKSDEDHPIFDLGSKGRLPDETYQFVNDKGLTCCRVVLKEVGVKYGPFVSTKGFRFRAEFSQSAGCTILLRRLRSGNGVRRRGDKLFFTEADALSFSVVPIVPNASFVLIFDN